MIRDALYQFALNSISEMVFIFTKDGVIVYANSSARNQLAYQENILECLISDIFPSGFEMVSDRFLMKCKADGEVAELMAYRQNKTCFPVKARLFRYNMTPGLYLLVAMNDTEHVLLEKKVNQADQEAEEAQKVKTEFVANVTHELRTPINGIQGNMQELLTIETDPEKRRFLKLIEHGCRDMNSIINSILDFSKLEAGKFTLEKREFNLHNTIEYVKENNIRQITEKGLNFSVTVSSEVPEIVIGDELRIVQVLNNLLSNAYKFTSVGKIVMEVIKTAQYNNRVELFFMVIDSGIGMEKADLDKLFKSFTQVDASISRKYGGTGLGLNICKQLVELMGGTIHVESEKKKGTIFSFNIWVEIPGTQHVISTEAVDMNAMMSKMKEFSEVQVSEDIWIYGKPENLEELRKKMSKLILCVEMENWEKAESFADIIKQLTKKGPKEVKETVLRLKMAVQSSNYEKSVDTYEALKELVGM